MSIAGTIFSFYDACINNKPETEEIKTNYKTIKEFIKNANKTIMNTEHFSIYLYSISEQFSAKIKHEIFMKNNFTVANKIVRDVISDLEEYNKNLMTDGFATA